MRDIAKEAFRNIEKSGMETDDDELDLVVSDLRMLQEIIRKDNLQSEIKAGAMLDEVFSDLGECFEITGDGYDVSSNYLTAGDAEAIIRAYASGRKKAS